MSDNAKPGKVITNYEEQINHIFEKNKVKTTVMIADMVESTSIKEKLGSEKAWKKILMHNKIITDIIEKKGGRVIKEMGDAVMARFDNENSGPRQAVDSAIEIQDALNIDNAKIQIEIEKIKTKIGVAYCDMDAFSPDGLDLIGLPVDVAARLSALAVAEQILVTKVVSDLVRDKSGDDIKFSRPQVREIKGIEGKIEVVEVDWGKGLLGIKRWEDVSTINRLSQKLDLLDEHIKGYIENRLPLLEQCKKAGITAVLPPRRIAKTKLDQTAPKTDFLPESGKYLVEYLIKYLKDNPDPEKVIKVYGIANQDFFLPGTEIFKLLENWAIHHQSKSETKLTVQAILLNPESDAAKMRCHVEYGKILEDYKDSFVYQDIRGCVMGLRRLLKRKNESFNLEVKFSDFLPQVWFMITNEFVFFEPYHLGRHLEEEEYFCLGGRIPVIQANEDSEYYTYFDNHFNFLWDVGKSSLAQFFHVKDMQTEGN